MFDDAGLPLISPAVGMLVPEPTAASSRHAHTYKVELSPTPEQVRLLGRYCGAARYVYNWGLGQAIAYYAAHKDDPDTKKKGLSHYDLSKRLTLELHDNPDMAWLRDVASSLLRQALENLGKAYQRFFANVKQQKHEKGFPRRKTRGDGGSFTLQGANANTDGVYIPKIGVIAYRRTGYVPDDLGDTRGLRTTITERAGRWWVSLHGAWHPKPRLVPGAPIVGVDIGIEVMAWAADQDGNDCGAWDNPRPLKRYEKRLARLQRQLLRKPYPKSLANMKRLRTLCKDPRKQARLDAAIAQLAASRSGEATGYKNREKLRRQIAALHLKIAHIRTHALHECTTRLARTHATICRETLNVKGMMRNRKLAKALADVKMGEFDRQMAYKCERYGTTLIKADRWYPSSKRCSQCHAVNAYLLLRDRTFYCPSCGCVLPRDLNAAINLASLGGTRTAEDSTAGCSPRRRLRSRRASKGVAMNEELLQETYREHRNLRELAGTDEAPARLPASKRAVPEKVPTLAVA